MWSEFESAFHALCAAENRRGILAAAPLAEVRLLPEQAAYLQTRLEPLRQPPQAVTAVSLGIAYDIAEIAPIPREWVGRRDSRDRWNEYAMAYHEVNRCLAGISRTLAERFRGIAEGPTIEGIAGKLSHVTEYFPRCVSHRAVAEVARLGWRGKHGLIVTPEFGPALRLATLFLPERLEGPTRMLAGCGECSACLEICPVLKKGLREADPNIYRERCRRRIVALGLEANVCGLCVRRCHEAVVGGQ